MLKKRGDETCKYARTGLYKNMSIMRVDEKISCFYHMIMTPNGKNMVSTTKNNSIARAAYLKLVKTLNKRQYCLQAHLQ